VHTTFPETLLSEFGRVRAPARLLPTVLKELGLGSWYATVDSLVGPVNVAWGHNGLVAISRVDEEEDFEGWFRWRFGHAVRRAESLPPRLQAEVQRGLAGERTKLPFDLARLTPFERDVLTKTSQIPRGEVRSYGWVAKEIGRPLAVRAVGSALAGNPIPLVIPCHRVVRSDLHIGHYGCGGPEAKRLLLEAEGAEPVKLEELGRRGIRFLGSDSTHIFCLPTCRNARRITPRHRVELRSERQAFDLGYRACAVCRPVGATAA
jgi:O-6-methylguanine DNA methyltransferase